MRVIAGQAKGLHLESPNKSTVRPTTELVRGAIFSMLEVMIDDWTPALDMYAGSGALGIEALSRGAQWVDFVEQNAKCCSIIKGNLIKVGFQDLAHVYCMNAHQAIFRLTSKYKIVLMDPPYANAAIPSTVERLLASALINDDSTVVVQHSLSCLLAEAIGNFSLVKNRHYGDTCISIYQKGALPCS